MKKLIILFLASWMLVSSMVAQTVLVENRSPEERDIFALIKDLNSKESAYRPIALQRILAEVNFSSERLKLPPPHPIKISDINNLFIGPPWYNVIQSTNSNLSKIDKIRTGNIGISGRIETTNYIYGFSEGGRRFSIVNKLQPEEISHHRDWAEMPSLVNTDEAYQLATQWLASIDVNIALLKKKYGLQAKIEQSFFWNQPGLGLVHPPGDTNKTMLPIFNVTWGEGPGGEHPVQVRVFGPTKELMELHLFDSSLSRRPPMILSSVAGFEKFINAQTNLPVLHLQHFKNNPPALDFTNARPPPFQTEVK